MTRIVIHPAVEPDRLAAFQLAAPGALFVNAANADEARAAMPGAAAFLGKITPELLTAAQKLSWVQSFTASLEHYMFPALVAHPCTLTNTRGLFSDVIADQVMGYILCFARNLHTYIRNQLDHRYEPVGGEAARVSFASGPGTVNAMDRATIFLPEARLGILGLGAIGQEIARRAQAFGMTIRAVDRYPERIPPDARFGVAAIDPPDQLPDLIAWSDFLVIATPQTPETERLFDASLLAHFQPGAYLINIGRGAIVVLDDLVAALQAGQLAGAALDVFETEPLPPAHPLWAFPQVILTPHTAGYAPVIAHRHRELIRDNLRRFLAGEPLRNVVDKALWF
jgi:phosphoglycerate dehydrogenase-like enzyme